MKAVLIDDEPKNNSILARMLADYCPNVTLAGMAGNSRTGISLIRETQPDLVFLDIEMPYGNAFDMLDQIQPVDFDVIFVTAFDAYALRALKYNALDYLLKPVDIDELKVAVQKAFDRKEREISQTLQLENLLKNIANPGSAFSRLALPSVDGLLFIDVENIIRCESRTGYTHFLMKNGEKLISTKNIKEYEDILPDTLFLRVHNSHLVNINCIRKYYKGRGGAIEMEDGTLIEVATRRRDELLLRFGFKK